MQLKHTTGVLLDHVTDQLGIVAEERLLLPGLDAVGEPFADARHIDEGCAPDAGKFGKALAASEKVQEPIIGDLSRDLQQTGANRLEVGLQRAAQPRAFVDQAPPAP